MSNTSELKYERRSQIKTIFVPYETINTDALILMEKCNITSQISGENADAIVFTDFPEGDLQKWKSYSSRNKQVWIYNINSLPTFLKDSKEIYFDWISTRSLSSHVPFINRCFNKNKLIENNYENLTNKSIIVTSKICSEKVNTFLDDLRNHSIDATPCCNESCTYEFMLRPKDSDIMKFVLLVELDQCSDDWVDDFYRIISYQQIPVLIGSEGFKDIYQNLAPNSSYYYLESLKRDNVVDFITKIKNWHYNTNAMRQIEDAFYYSRLCTLLHLNPNVSNINMTNLIDDKEKCLKNKTK